MLGTGQVHRLTLLTLDKDLDRLAKLLPGYST
ncbi:MAG TPA: hypothetical protein P5329_14160 [Candidatus Competibacteraceae bacterium]|nr:hypothetical protein [Candidatus Competibacteraceae bacterium]